MLELPRIKIEVENMKYAIIHAFSSHNREIEEVVNKQLEAAIANYPFEAEVYRLSGEIITQSIKDSLSDYFKYGEGRKAIDELVKNTLKGVED